jgi:hypothetical protein
VRYIAREMFMFGRTRIAPGQHVELAPGAAEPLLRRGWLEEVGGALLPTQPPTDLSPQKFTRRGRPRKDEYQHRMLIAE